MTQDDLIQNQMTQSDLEWPKLDMDMVWMTQYDFRWVKSIALAPFWGPSDLDISIYSDSVTSQRETTILWISISFIYFNHFKKMILLEYAFKFALVFLLLKQPLIMHTFLNQSRIEKSW